MKCTSLFVVTAMVLLSTLSSATASDETKFNVLFIAVDDLRPQLHCYGHEEMITPNIDALARRGMVFQRAYCQAAVCRASRLSVLTGLRPDSTQIYDNGGRHFRTRLPDLVTLPQHFKNHGYHSRSLGKIYHGAFHVRGQWNDAKSWSVPAWWPGPRYYYTPEGVAAARDVFTRTRPNKNVPVDDWVNHFVLGPSHEAPDVKDNVLYDGQVADRAIATLREIHEEPFFLAVGFLKPHLPFIAPQKYWEMYPAKDVRVAANQHPPQDVPQLALTNWNHPRSYTDVPNSGPMPEELTATLTRGYAACVTYVDAQIGRVLDELDRLGLRERTIVVLWGDHGYHLGENAIWGKATNFELSTRVPLIVAAPQMKAAGKSTNSLVELVDLYPTLCDLAELPLPEHLQGRSMAPLLDDPQQPGKRAAFSQYPRGRAMGRSMCTDRWRLTRWTEGDKTVAWELYDHENDPGENTNVAAHSEHQELVKQLSAQLDAGGP